MAVLLSLIWDPGCSLWDRSVYFSWNEDYFQWRIWSTSSPRIWILNKHLIFFFFFASMRVNIIEWPDADGNQTLPLSVCTWNQTRDRRATMTRVWNPLIERLLLCQEVKPDDSGRLGLTSGIQFVIVKGPLWISSSGDGPDNKADLFALYISSDYCNCCTCT